jgi:hypothetical protein
VKISKEEIVAGFEAWEAMGVQGPAPPLLAEARNTGFAAFFPLFSLPLPDRASAIWEMSIDDLRLVALYWVCSNSGMEDN